MPRNSSSSAGGGKAGSSGGHRSGGGGVKSGGGGGHRFGGGGGKSGGVGGLWSGGGGGLRSGGGSSTRPGGGGGGKGSANATKDFGSSPKTSTVSPASLRFTQGSIKGSFSKGGAVDDAIRDIKSGKLNISEMGPLKVHTGKDGGLYSDDNRRLYVARRADVPSVPVKVHNNDFKSRSLSPNLKNAVRNPSFFPVVRGSASGSTSP